MDTKFLKIAVFYALLGIGMGVVMGASGNFVDKSVHAHFNLLGWLSMAVMGLCYRVLPELSVSRLAPAHFWLHNLGLPVLMAGVFSIVHGRPELGEPLAGIGSIIVAAGFFCFALNVWLNLGKQDAAVTLALSRI